MNLNEMHLIPKNLRKISKKVCLIAIFFCFSLSQISFAGKMFQDFEPDNGSTTYGWSTQNYYYYVNFSPPATPIRVHEGERSWMNATNSPLYYWPSTGVASQVETWDMNFDITKNDRLTFWFYNDALWGGHHNVSVTFFDNDLYADEGFEIWTTNSGRYSEWNRLTILFSQLPPDFDLAHIHHLIFKTYWPNKYYYDNIASVREDRVYQAFEPQLRNNAPASEYGWKWNDEDTVDFSSQGEPVYEGSHSWKLTTPLNWSGTGIQSQEKKIVETTNGWEQDFWHVDLHPEKNDRLILYVYSQSANELDNNLAVQFYDHDLHHTDLTKAVAWTKKAAQFGNWTRMEIPFSDLPATLELNDLNKIQLQQYWPGTYYFDNIRASGPIPKINEEKLYEGLVRWEPVAGAGKYILEESRLSANGPWMLAYEGPNTQFNVTRVTNLWYRVRWVEPSTTNNPIPYKSVWSDVAEYVPPIIFIKQKSLENGFVEWNRIPQANLYEVQSAYSKDGPWTKVYKGSYNHPPLTANPNKWYRVRGLNLTPSSYATCLKKVNNHTNYSICLKKAARITSQYAIPSGEITDITNWSQPQSTMIQKGFLKASETIIRENNGAGDEVILQGVNLGGLLLIEKWMTGLGEGDNPPIEDDWTIRDILSGRFTEEQVDTLLTTYQEAYIDSIDFDKLKNMRMNFVRLPIFYRILQDDNGNWILNDQGQIDFSKIDRIVDSCADRGIYVLLDLHGAPGGQSAEAHTGRKDFNKLFEDSPEGQLYRDRTVQIWEAIATHYQNNAFVAGYDLLNEPIGAPTNQTLWDLYDRIYDAIRAIDNNHIIIMEGIWDWDTLPNPSVFGWDNVVYQFHYYLWGHDEDLNAHMDFINQKIADANIYQPQYNVPAMVGEFFAFSIKSIWEYYLQEFNDHHFSWSSWTYKFHNSPSEWGLFNHTNYNEELPKLREIQQGGGTGDSYETLIDKLNRYKTTDYHSFNYSLTKLFKKHAVNPITTKPTIDEIIPGTIFVYGDFTILGKNFGETQGSNSVLFNGIPIPVVNWTDTSIHAYVPSSTAGNKHYGMVSVQTSTENSNSLVLHIIQPPKITNVNPSSAQIGTEIKIYGKNFSKTVGEVQFYPAPGSDNNGLAEITYWSDRLVKCIVPDDAITGPATLQIPYGNDVFSFTVLP